MQAKNNNQAPFKHPEALDGDPTNQPDYWVWKCCFYCSCCANKAADAPPQDFMKPFLMLPMVFCSLSINTSFRSLLFDLQAWRVWLFFHTIPFTFQVFVFLFAFQARQSINSPNEKDKKVIHCGGVLAVVWSWLGAIIAGIAIAMGIAYIPMSTVIAEYLLKHGFINQQGKDFMLKFSIVVAVTVILGWIWPLLMYLCQISNFKKYKMGVQKICLNESYETMAQSA